MEKLRYAELQKKEYEKRLNHTRYVLEQSIEKMEKDIEEKQKHSEDKLHELLLIKEKNLRRQQEINKVKNKKYIY